MVTSDEDSDFHEIGNGHVLPSMTALWVHRLIKWWRSLVRRWSWIGRFRSGVKPWFGVNLKATKANEIVHRHPIKSHQVLPGMLAESISSPAGSPKATEMMKKMSLLRCVKSKI